MFRKPSPFDPELYSDAVRRQRCFQCSGEYEDWDEKLHQSLFSFLPECGKIRGQLVRYCQRCLVGEIYFVTNNGISDFTWQIALDYIPPNDFLESEVSIDTVQRELTPTDEAVTEFKLESRIFLDSIKEGDTIRPFCSPTEDWQQLAGRKGYAIIRDGRPVIAILTMLN